MWIHLFAGHVMLCVPYLSLPVASHSSAEVLQGWPPGVPAVVCHMLCWPLGYVTGWVAVVGFVCATAFLHFCRYCSFGSRGEVWYFLGPTFLPFLVL